MGWPKHTADGHSFYADHDRSWRLKITMENQSLCTCCEGNSYEFVPDTPSIVNHIGIILQQLRNTEYSSPQQGAIEHSTEEPANIAEDNRHTKGQTTRSEKAITSGQTHMETSTEKSTGK